VIFVQGLDLVGEVSGAEVGIVKSRAPPQSIPTNPLPQAEGLSATQEFGLAVVTASAALGVALLMDKFHFRGLISPFLFALAVAAWYGGTKPAILPLIVSVLSYDYFFTEPRYSLSVTAADIPDCAKRSIRLRCSRRSSAIRRLCGLFWQV
jgi:K+-sensing histidine kinase KdpD